MYTADTITDDEIHALHLKLWDEYAATCLALGFRPHGGKHHAVRADRVRCAEILNARQVSQTPHCCADNENEIVL